MQGCPCKACSLLCVPTSWEGASDPGRGQSQVSAFRLTLLHKYRKFRRGQEKSVSLPTGARLCPEVPLHWVAQLQDPACAAQPLSSAVRQRVLCNSRKPCALPCCISEERVAEGRGKIRGASVHAEGAGTAQQSLAAWPGVGRKLGAPHYLR